MKSEKFYLLTNSALLLMQLVFLFVVKYLNQELSFSNFSLSKIGNVFDLLIYFGILSGIYLSVKVKKNGISNKTINIYVIVTWSLLVISFLSTKIKIFSDDFYLFGQPVDKLLTGILFTIFLLSLFYFLIFLWNRLLGNIPSFIKTVYSTVLMLIIFLVFIFIYIDNFSYSSGKWALSRDDHNTVVVLGAAVWTGNVPSPTLSSRVDKAIELFRKGFAGTIVLTGGRAPGEMPESEVAYEYAKIKGIDTSRIIIEKLTSSTTSQIEWIKKNLFSDKKSVGKVIIVSDGYHLPRVIEISKFFNIDVLVAQSDHKLNFKDKLYNKIRESIALFIFWNFAL